MIKKAGLFLGVGSIGAIVDAAIFFLGTSWLQLGFVAARLLASFIALTVTWWLNRSLTFRESRLSNLAIEYLRYLAASSGGVMANLAASYPISLYDAGLSHIPAYIVGAAAGMVVNYLLYDRLVFTRRRNGIRTEKA